MNEDGNGLREEALDISGALSRGTLVSVSARIGNDVEGYVCDRDGAGLLLDTRDPSGDPASYEYLPWSSIERVSLSE